MTTRTISEARAELPALLSRVADGEEVTITRHGLAVAVLVRPDALRARRAESALAGARRLHEMLDAARQRDAPPTLSVRRAEELVEHVRASRDAR